MSQKGKKFDILILISSLEGGGAERIAAYIVNYLSARYSILLTSIMHNQQMYEISVPIHYLTRRSYQNRWIVRLLYPLIATRHLFTVLTARPKVSLSILCRDNILNMFVCMLTHRKAIISIHDMRSHTAKTSSLLRVLVSLESCLLKHTNAKAISVSEGAKQDLVVNYGVSPDKIHVIYNPIDVEKIRTLCREEVADEIIPKDIPVIFTAGRLSSVKSQWHLIRSFAVLRRECRVRLLISGVGEEENYLKSLAKSLGVENDVIFLGWQDNPYKYMSRSTVFVLSSISEGLPNVLIEAMASGCPVISSDCSPGVREIIGENNEYGMLAEKMTGIRHGASDLLDEGEDSLLELMRKVIDDKELRELYVRRGEERAEFFSMERRVEEYANFIQTYIAGK